MGRGGLSGKIPRPGETHQGKRLAEAWLPLTLLRWTSLLFYPLGNSPSSSSLLGKAVRRPPLPRLPGLAKSAGPAEDLKVLHLV